MNITPLVWLITIAVTIVFFVYEFFAHVRKPHEPSHRRVGPLVGLLHRPRAAVRRRHRRGVGLDIRR